MQGITFTIQPGEFFALLGPNGAGKTSAIHILTGLANKTTGEARLFGKDIVTDYTEARSLIGLVPQELNLDQFEKVWKVLYFNAGYFGIPRSKRASRIELLLRELNLWGKKDAKVRELSGGMKRKLLIARALIHQPKILILDEPTAGVDVETRKFLWNYLRRLNRQGITVLLTTHYIEEAEELCERIAIISGGKIVALDRKESLLALLERETISITLKCKVENIPAALQKFKAQLSNGTLTISFNPKEQPFSLILKALYDSKLPILKIYTRRTTLEEVFVHLTGKNLPTK